MRAPTSRNVLALVAPVIAAWATACGSNSGIVPIKSDSLDSSGYDSTDGSGNTGDGTGGATDENSEELTGDWTGSSLVVLSPRPGEVLPYGETSEFSAIVVDASGEETDFTDLAWSSDVGGWTGEGATLDVDDLDVGMHAISVLADLPDGTRLRNTVGGVKVQHPDAGTYVGNLIVDLTGEYNGTPITASCIGAAVVYVDAYGETATGDSTCVIGLLGFSTEAKHVFDFMVTDNAVEGDVSLDLSFFQLDFGVTGTLEDAVITAEWTTDFSGFLTINGGMELDRVSTEVDFGE